MSKCSVHSLRAMQFEIFDGADHSYVFISAIFTFLGICHREHNSAESDVFWMSRAVRHSCCSPPLYRLVIVSTRHSNSTLRARLTRKIGRTEDPTFVALYHWSPLQHMPVLLKRVMSGKLCFWLTACPIKHKSNALNVSDAYTHMCHEIGLPSLLHASNVKSCI